MSCEMSKQRLLLLVVLIISCLSLGASVLLLLVSGKLQSKHDIYMSLISELETSSSIERDSEKLAVESLKQANITKRELRTGCQTPNVSTILVDDLVNKDASTHTLTERLKRLCKKKYRSKTSNHHLNRSPITPNDLCSQSTSLCTEFLTVKEQAVYSACVMKWQKDGGADDSHCKCRFMNTTSHGPVALVSLPGSGNTWLRGLLEAATGVCTGSLFCDKVLQASGMCGEGLRKGVLAVKIHDTRLQWTGVAYKNGTWSNSRPFFNAVILLVRSPFKALIAEWNRQNAHRFSINQPGSSHIKYLESSVYFLENDKWDGFVSEQIRRWKMIIAENLIRNRGHPILVVHYEQLKSSDLMQQVQRILEFLQFPYSEEKVRAAVESGYSMFYRNHTDSFQHFTLQQRMTINTAISETAARVRAHNFTELENHLEAYITP